MNIHEYQAKEILLEAGIPVPEFAVASNESEVKAALDLLDLKEAVLKVQIHAGGRGKAGGVKFAKSKEEILAISHQLLGMNIVNEQTGKKGVIAKEILITKPINIDEEYYLAALVDRERAEPILIISKEGGMEIEKLAETNPEKILRIPFLLDGRIRSWHLIHIAQFMNWKGELKKEGLKIVSKVAQIFCKTDASLLEINPLVRSGERLWALDAKFSLDDNAFFRQAKICSYYDPSQSSANEVMAKEFDLAYIGLEGEIGCLVNGAGLAMATMDIIQYYGGSPSNFLDVGGSATKEEIAHGFRIILQDPHVKAIFVNIFGGIMNCGVLAEGIIAASEADKIHVPLIVRMEGTNVEQGRALLKKSGLSIITVDSMAEGAIAAVKAAKG